MPIVLLTLHIYKGSLSKRIGCKTLVYFQKIIVLFNYKNCIFFSKLFTKVEINTYGLKLNKNIGDWKAATMSLIGVSIFNIVRLQILHFTLESKNTILHDFFCSKKNKWKVVFLVFILQINVTTKSLMNVHASPVTCRWMEPSFSTKV